MVFIGIMYAMVLQDYMVPPSLKPFSRRNVKYYKYRAKWQKVGPGGGEPYIYIMMIIHMFCAVQEGRTFITHPVIDFGFTPWVPS